VLQALFFNVSPSHTKRVGIQKLADSIFRQYDTITHTFIQESKATITAYKKLRLTLRKFTDLIAKILK
jgi:hypothetical protein